MDYITAELTPEILETCKSTNTLVKDKINGKNIVDISILLEIILSFADCRNDTACKLLKPYSSNMSGSRCL